jgi:hypothetical protein
VLFPLGSTEVSGRQQQVVNAPFLDLEVAMWMSSCEN